jgi:hypothetical protein
MNPPRVHELEPIEFPVDIISASLSGLLDGTPYQQRIAAAHMASYVLGIEVGEGDVGYFLPHLVDEIGQQHPAVAEQPDQAILGIGGLVLKPMADPESLARLQVARINRDVSNALDATVSDFFIRYSTNDAYFVIPSTYQILEPGFRPYKQGKASGDELNEEVRLLVETAQTRGVDLGINSHEALRKLAIQMGYGIDCSNFAYRFLERAHDRLNLGPYEDRVYKQASVIRQLYENGRYTPVEGMSAEDAAYLADHETLPVSWVCRVFGKDPEHLISAADICANVATEAVSFDKVVTGDIIKFVRPANGKTTHVAVVDEVRQDGKNSKVSLWHSWHSREFKAGLRSDYLLFDAGQNLVGATHPRLMRSDQYALSFRRPNGFVTAYGPIAQHISLDRAARDSQFSGPMPGTR